MMSFIECHDQLHVNCCRADMHHLVAEITQQLEQQYSCRENFHRLRAENETSALQSAKQKVLKFEVISRFVLISN